MGDAEDVRRWTDHRRVVARSVGIEPDLERILGKALFGHMTLHAGIPFASGAMDIANEIFTSD